MKILERIFRSRKKEPEKDFSVFFNSATQAEKINLLEKVVREANEDQRRLMEEGRRASS